MKLHELSPVEGSKKDSKRIGRGHGSGWGKLPVKVIRARRLVQAAVFVRALKAVRCHYSVVSLKRFQQYFAKAVAAVNLSTLNRKFEDGATVDIEALVNAGVVKNGFDAVKILGNGKLDKKLTVKVSAFSESAKAAIEAAGGKAEVI